MKSSEANTLNPNAISFDVFNTILDGIVIFNSEGVILDVNRAFCQFIGLDRGQIIGTSLEKYVPENRHYKLKRQEILLERNGNTRGVLPILNKNGIFYFDVVTTIDKINNHYIAVFRDVTEKTKLKMQSAQYDYFFKELFIEAMDGIIFWDLKGNIINANQAACRIFGCSYQELIGSNFRQFNLKKDKNYKKIIKQLFETGAVSDRFQICIPNGTVKLIEFNSRLHSVDGFHMTIFRDISEKYHMEQELINSEQKFRRIFEGSLEGLILWNDEAEVVDINQAACKIFKLHQSNLIGKSLIELMPDKNGNKQNLRKLIDVLKRDGKLHGTFNIYENEDSVRSYEYSSIYHLFSNINFIVFKDVTEKIEMEKRLKKSDTLNVVGELAAGIAHEIRNPMTALKGFIQLLQDEIKEDRNMYFHVILSELNRIDSIINEFLILAKPQVVKYTKTNLTRIMKETVDLLTAQALLYNVQFVSHFENDLPDIQCEPNQLKKVFVNLIKNAIEVMHNGGKVTIDMGTVDNNTIFVSIRDEGIGIPPEKLKKLGEPFYTTKERGTGLGLMVSYKIIEEHSGRIEVRSQEGIGTTFRILLPTQNKEGESEKRIRSL